MSLAHDFGEEKGPAPHAYDETPIARGVRTNSDEHRRGSRKASVVASIKAGYGLADHDVVSVREGFDLTHRKLKARHIQLIGIGGTIGTALYVQIGRGLLNGGPGSLFLAFTIWYVLHHPRLHDLASSFQLHEADCPPGALSSFA
jgi:hypothetical protein